MTASLDPAVKLWQLLLPAQRREAAVLFTMMLVGMVLETLGVGLVIPALALMTQNDLAGQYPSVSPWLERLGNPGRERLIVAGMIALVAVYAFRSVFLGFLTWGQARFIASLQISLSQRLFEGYLRQPYVFHLQRNSAILIRNAIGQVSDISNAIQYGLTIATELLVLFGISVLLLLVEPVGASLVVMTLAVAGWGFNRVAGRHGRRWGAARQHHEGKRIQYLQEGLGGAKEIKLLGREEDFLAQYQLHNEGSARAAERRATLEALPRLWLEFLAVAGLAALVALMIAQGKPVEFILPTLGLFAAAAFRIMPSVGRVLASLQGFRFSLPAILTLHSEFKAIESTEPVIESARLPFQSELRLVDISFRYPASDAFVLNSVSLSIPRGESVGFIGESGAGKSTLVDIVLGLLHPETGTVRVDGTDIQTNLRGWEDQIGYVPQSIFLTDDTLRRNVAFGLPPHKVDEGAVVRAIQAAQLDRFVAELPQGLDTMVGERGVRLSGGQRQRIGIARALYHDPAVLVLDEATSSLDTETESGFMDAIRALRGTKTLLIVAHRLSTVQNCDRIFRVEHGKITCEGTPVELPAAGAVAGAGR